MMNTDYMMDYGYFFFLEDSIYDSFYARIPSGIKTRDELFSALSEVLSLPEYFGWNWDALYDLLRDLSWICEHAVILAHSDMPMDDPQLQRAYLEILKDSASDWKSGEAHKLIVTFPSSVHEKIGGILKAS